MFASYAGDGRLGEGKGYIYIYVIAFVTIPQKAPMIFIYIYISETVSEHESALEVARWLAHLEQNRIIPE